MRRRRQQDNSSYLSDLAFLLIIFFILLAGSTTIRKLSVDLGDGIATAAVPQEATTLTLYVGPEGRWSDANETTVNSKTELRALLQPNTTEQVTALYLGIDPEATWEHVTPILAVCEEQGIPVFMEESL